MRKEILFRIVLSLVFGGFLFFCPDRCFSQATDRVPLTQFIDSLQTKFGVSFSYNSTLLQPLYIKRPTIDLTLNQSRDYLTNQLPLEIQKAGDSEFLILPVRSTVQFTVLDEKTHKLVPVIMVAVNSSPLQYVVAKDSVYSIPDLFVTDSIRVQSQFYNTAAFTVEDIKSHKSKLYLQPDTVHLSEVAIVGYLANGVSYKVSNHAIEVKMQDLGLLAGETDGDVLLLLKSMPGIKTPSGKPGELTIRGSQFSNNLIYYDNIPVYHQGHYFGTISPFNPDVVDKMYVYRGALPAQRGGRVGGLIDIRSSDDIPDELHGGLSLNTVYNAAQIKFPLVENKLGLILSSRSNYPFENLSPKMQRYSDLNFQGSKIAPEKLDADNVLQNNEVMFRDMNAKLIYKINENHKATISFLSITDKFNYTFNSMSRNNTERQEADLVNQGLAFNYQAKISSNLSAKILGSYSRLNIQENLNEEETGVVRKSEYVTNKLKDYKVGGEVNYKFNQMMNLSLGYELLQQDITHVEENQNGAPPPDRKMDAITHSVYGNMQKTFANKIITELGVHNDYYKPLNKWYFDPRVSVSYLATHSLSFKTSAGRSHQFITKDLSNDFEDFLIKNHFWFLANDKRLPLEGYQAMIGASLDLPGWIVDMELYSKKTLNVYKHINPGQQGVPMGNIYSKGAELFVKKRWTQVETWVSYTLNKTEADFESKEIVYFDQTHSVNMMLMGKYKRWNAALSWSLNTGMPVVLPQLNPQANPNPDTPESLSIPYKNRFPNQHQMDFSITYQLWPSNHRLKGVVGLSFQNLYNRENIINLYQKQISTYDYYRNTLGFSPNVQVKVSF